MIPITRRGKTASLSSTMRSEAARVVRDTTSFVRQHLRATLACAGILGGVALTAVLVGSSLPASATPQAGSSPTAAASPDSRSTMGPIVGTWVVQVTPHGAPLPPFQSTLAFTPGGVVIEATSKPQHTPTGQVTDSTEGLGAWSMSGSSTVHIQFHKYNFDANGNYTGQTTIVETDTISSDGASYAGLANVTVTSPSGVIIVQSTATSSGTQMSA